MQLVEFVIPGQPVSSQARRRDRVREWEGFVQSCAKNAIASEFRMTSSSISLVLYYFHTDVPLDIDNFIKPIQDALIGVVYADDASITDLTIRKRDLRGSYKIERVSPILARVLEAGEDFIYVSASTTSPKEVAI